ncbi:PAS domain S-box-containing protein [Actinacidiphila yanglinensis]|uniref:PAS domain S-box-containing protein n=1 Tax=Actinacidiphila yanglinensis TaxID=310779 RepID=A0A1H6DFR7_9ACTN|nr:SpoIIE family protein phosphatase [Actinacidiphila yanglinensis]SEG84208.1 PAS domain S-box-containing protein [Actinacidiphila yanglinensis]
MVSLSEGGPLSSLGSDVFDSMAVAVVVTHGPEHRIAYTNEPCRRLFGDLPLGTPMREAFHDATRAAYFEVLDHVLATGRPKVITAAPADMLQTGSRVGRACYVTCSVSRLTTADGTYGLLAVILEVTEQVSAAERDRVLSEEWRRAFLRYSSLVSATSQVIWAMSPRGGVIERSPGWEQMTGQRWEEYRGDGWTDALHPDDRGPVVRDWYAALAEVPPVFTTSYRVRTVDGSYRHVAVEAAPVIDNDHVLEWVGTCKDVEQEWQETRREDLLARASARTAGMVQLEEILVALTHVVVPALADACAVYLLPQALRRPGRTQSAERVAATTRPDLPPLPPHREEHLRPGSPLAHAVEHRVPVQATFPPGTPPLELAPPGTEPWMPPAANSVILLPVVVEGTVAALVTATVCGDRQPLGQPETELLGQLLERAHEPLKSALEYQRTKKLALALQRSLLTDPPDLPDLHLTVRYRPSNTAAEIGGDWYDSFELSDGSLVLTIGDVTGHDLPAAVTMSQLRTMLRGLALDRQEATGAVLRRLDMSVQTLYLDCTATCILGRVKRPGPDRFAFHYSVAGHPPPLLVEADHTARFLTAARDPLIGLDPDPHYASAIEQLPPGSTLLLYTDGLVERRHEDIDISLERLRRHALDAAHLPPADFCDALLAKVPADDNADDMAVMALRVPQPPRPTRGSGARLTTKG